MRTFRLLAPMVFALVLSVGASMAGGELRPGRPPSTGLGVPEHIPPPVRAAIKTRMARHGTAMLSLVRSVVLLDHPTTARLAKRIADEEMLARATSVGGVQAETALPGSFFDLQDTLRSEADRLAQAAVAADDLQVAEGFGAVARTCVSCHRVYLTGEPLEP